MRSPIKVATIQATILNFLTEQEPLKPAGSPTEASIPPDLALGGTTFEEGGMGDPSDRLIAVVFVEILEIPENIRKKWDGHTDGPYRVASTRKNTQIFNI